MTGGFPFGPKRADVRILAAAATGFAAPADTNENTLVSFVVPGGIMGPNGVLRVNTIWSTTNNANSKTRRYKLGSLTFVNEGMPSMVASRDIDRFLMNRGRVDSQLAFSMNGGAVFTAGSTGVFTGNVNTDLDQNFSITLQKATAGDSVILEAFVVELLRPDVII